MFEIVRKIGLWNVCKAIWDIICLFIRSLFNKTDVLTEYQKECDETAQKMMDCLMQTDEGRDLFANYENLLKEAAHNRKMDEDVVNSR